MNHKNLLAILLILLIIAGITIRILSINKDYFAEELNFVMTGEALKNTGRPLYYHSEQDPIARGLWHPPMYVFLLSLIFRIFPNEIGARSINIFFSILTSIIILLFCIKNIEDKKGKIIGLIASAFFLINYYSFSSSFIIDIDALSTFFISSFIFSIIMIKKEKNKKSLFFVSSSSLFFALFNRFQIAILVYFFLGLYHYFNKEFRKNIKNYIFIGIFSFFSFIIIWGIYSVIIEPGNFFYFINHNIGLGLKGEQFSSLLIYSLNFILNIVQFIRLVTLPAVILIFGSFFYFLKRKESLIRILFISSLTVLLFFFLIPRPAFGFPRYFLSAFPMLSVLLGIFIHENLYSYRLNKKIFLIIIFSFFISFALLIILRPQLTLYSSDGLVKSTNLPDFLFNIFASIPLMLIFLFKKGIRKKIFVMLLLTILLSYSIYFDFRLVNHESYTKEVGKYIKSITEDSGMIIAPQSVAYYAERKFYINDFRKPPLKKLSILFLKEYIVKSFKNRKMDDEFFYEGGLYAGTSFGPYNPSEESLKRASYVVLSYPINNRVYEKKIEDFYIYKLN